MKRPRNGDDVSCVEVFPFDLGLVIVLMLMTRQHAQAEDFSKGPLQGVHHPHTGSRSEDFSSGSI